MGNNNAKQTNNSYNRRLIEASIDPLVTIGPNGKITDVNKAAEIMTGVPREQLVGSDFSNYFTEPEKAIQGYKEIMLKGAVKDYPLTIKNISGKTTDILYNATLYKDENGEVGIFAAARDVTERKQMEEKLRESEERFRKIFENGRYGIILTGPDSKFIKVNPAFCQITGYTEAELLTKKFADITHPENVKADTESVPKLIKGEIPFYRTEKRYIRKTGEDVWVNLIISVIRDENGAFKYFLGMVEDISERKQAEGELKRGKEEAEQLNKYMTGRELKMAELKKEIEELKEKLKKCSA